MATNFGMGPTPDYARLNMTPEEIAAQHQTILNNYTPQNTPDQAAARSSAIDDYWKSIGVTNGLDTAHQIATDNGWYNPNTPLPTGPGWTDGAFKAFNSQFIPDPTGSLTANENSTFGQVTGQQAETAARQQQAFQQQQGGSATGGFLPANYSTPFQGQITGQPNDGISQTYQPWGTPGFGGPGGGAPIDQYSPGGLGGLGGMNSSGPTNGWGGPFSAKNPFSPS